MKQSTAVFARNVLALITATQYLPDGLVTMAHVRIGGRVTAGMRVAHVKCLTHEALVDMASHIDADHRPYVMVFPTFQDFVPSVPFDQGDPVCSRCGCLLSGPPGKPDPNRQFRTYQGWQSGSRY